MISTRLRFFLESQNLLVEEKAGFRDNMSTPNSLMRFAQYVKQGFNQKKKITLAVFIELKCAYDMIKGSKLISKLKMYRVRGNVLSWFGRFPAQS